MKQLILLVSGMLYLFLNTSISAEKTFEQKGYTHEAVFESFQGNDSQDTKNSSITAGTITLLIWFVSFINLATFENQCVETSKHFLFSVFYQSNYFQNSIHS
ncbi:hypothetical protein N0O92_13080 [Alkalihalobacillus sp. MEB130]|uniref:hypothetical protein n=1 Tax=Alkalihalobacillus sp. MEB130 TaxID=2976704 RepID=UPI0028DDCCA7|nr:hypothetical protein [Alkalihalobacillus sp. MEB130]MDT8861168.1 hypothetical protein [Alkalihalobacillus sp. MEB130]